MKSFIQVFSSRRMFVVLLLGFASGLPISLIGSTLQAWMKDARVDLTLIGLFSLVGLPYSLKFIWAPFMDRYVPPFLGRRRGWILVTQILLILGLSGMAISEPSLSLQFIAGLALLVAFASASQDIVIDAYKIEVLDPEEFGTGAATANLGYRLAMLFSGAVALILADHLPWKHVYFLMAGTMILCIGATLLAPEPTREVKIPRSLKEAVIEPFKEFFQRRGSLEVLLFITLYKLDVVMTLALMTAFFLEQGFTKTDIGAVTKGFGLIATLTGTFAGGIGVARLGIYPSLWIFGILQGISGLCFYSLAILGHHYPMMVLTIAAENFFSGMGNAAYLAFIMSLCNPKFTATQYALLSGLMAVTRIFAGAPSGWLVKQAGWANYYLISMSLAVPSLLLLLRYKKWAKTPQLES